MARNPVPIVVACHRVLASGNVPDRHGSRYVHLRHVAHPQPFE